MAHTSMKRLGSVSVPAARVMVTKPSSSGWRSVSSADLSNSGSSSRNRTPLWARDILLQVERGTAIYKIDYQGADADYNIVEFTMSYLNPAYTKFRFDVEVS